jgi:hypothetical protein
MSMTHEHRLRRLRIFAAGVFGVFAFYVVTVGAVSAIGRHMEDGRLQWMRGSSVASAGMEIYEWPARQLAVLPPMRCLFELSAAFWCGITDAPETTG